MIIDRGTMPYAVHADDPVAVALTKIAANKARLVFCVDSHGTLLGSISDGDFRRWVLATGGADLSQPASEIANRTPITARETDTVAEIQAAFAKRPGVERVPVVDERGRLVAVASMQTREVRIGSHAIGAGHPCVVIAEIGNNHQGQVDRARHLVDLAVEAGADLVKFQLRDMSALYRGSGDLTAGEDLGPQYTLNLLEKFSLTADQMTTVLDHCKDVGIEAICTPWDIPSLDHLVAYGLPGLKIASADLTNHTLLGAAAATHLPLLVSTGMSTEQEISESVELMRKAGAPYALLHCQSTYPAPFKDVNLRYLSRLAELGDCPVGYSGHERGFHIPVAAVALGASVVEKHFTVDKSLEGNDHKVSLLPDEFADMVTRIRELEESMGTASPRAVSTGEMMTRVNLAKSLVAARDIAIGDVIAAEAVTVKSPGRGLQPNHLGKLVGRTARRPITAGDFFYATDLSDKVSRGRSYTFRRPWGLPVRYHDALKLVEDATPDFLEFHFSYKDVEIDPATVFTERLPYSYTCHTPDLYAGDFLIDLASLDDAIWERSIRETQRVINRTRELDRWFTVTEPPVVICTMGGFRRDVRVPVSERRRLYDRIAQALARIDATDVRLTAQTLPPFPWFMGGQWYDNLFMDPEDTVDFCEREGVRLTLDISHTKLSANYAKRPFSEYVEAMAPYADHLHIVDATGVDGEGPQIGEGEVDWPQLAAQLDRLAPGVGFIPEIWQGHVNNGEGFWTALERLEEWF